MRVVLVYVYGDVPQDRFEKFGHVLNISKLDPCLMNLFSVSIAVLEAKEA